MAHTFHSKHKLSTPSWWIRDIMTKPQRTEVRRLIKQTLKLRDLENAPLFPLAKRPHEYYW